MLENFQPFQIEFENYSNISRVFLSWTIAYTSLDKSRPIELFTRLAITNYDLFYPLKHMQIQFVEWEAGSLSVGWG